MKKNVWLILCIIESIVIFCGFSLFFLSSIYFPKAKTINLQEYLEYAEDNNYFPEVGYISNAKTAKVVGSQIIDDLTGNNSFSISCVTVEYDEQNRLWKVSKGYLFKRGGLVIIEQDSGRVVKALFTK